MKTIYYGVIAIACFFLSACEKEEMVVTGIEEYPEIDENETYLINPEDTAGIVVPEGYKLVLFPATKNQTKAAANGTNTQIQHLQYLIYEKDGVDYKLYKKTVINKPGSWPAKVPAIPLQENKEYRVVFLGNVDKSLFGKAQTKEVLSGVNDRSNYSEARIHLPQVEFSDANLFFMANEIFDTNPGSIKDNSVFVPVTLRRIVNKVEICKEPLADVSKDYTQENLISQVLNENIIPKLGTSGGALHRGIAAAIDTLVMALVYVGTKDCATEADSYYANNPNTYTVLKYRYNNLGINKEYQLPELESGYNLKDVKTIVSVDKGDGSLIPEDFNYANSDMGQNIIIKLAQYIYNYYHEGLISGTNNNLFGDKGIIKNMWMSNVARIEKTVANGILFYDDDNNSVGKLNNLLTADLKTLFAQTVNADDATDKLKVDFSPLGINGSIYKVKVNRMPSSITFDLNVVEYLKETELALTMRRATEGYKGPTISIVSLGTPTVSSESLFDEKLTVSEIMGPYPAQGWDGTISTSFPSTGKVNILFDQILIAKQAANTYRKCVNSIKNVNIQDWNKKTNKTYPISYNLNTLFGQTQGDNPLYLTEVDKSGINYKYSLYVNGHELCFEIRSARASNLVTIYSQICNKLKVRKGYNTANPHISWITQPETKNNINGYILTWTTTNENYQLVSE